MIIAARNLDKRIPQKQQLILAELRNDIVEGRLALGAKLPTHVELAQRFSVSNVTIQRALDRLVHEGFIATNGRRGTFVTPRPPHVSRYAMVFPTGPVTDERWAWSRFWNSIIHEAARAKGEQGRDVTVYHDVNPLANSDDYFKLVDDIAAHRLAGMILMVPHVTVNAPLPGSEKLPRVGVGSTGGCADVDVVGLADMRDAALARLAACGKKRVAVISSELPKPSATAAWIDLIASHGMASRPHWIHGVSPNAAPWSRNLARLLVSGPASDRPDGLFITDDNLVEYVTAGLVDADVRVPADLEVVAHCNFPWVTPSVIRAQRLGFNVRDLMRHCLEAIDARRRGETPDSISLHAHFDHDPGHIAAPSPSIASTPSILMGVNP